MNRRGNHSTAPLNNCMCVVCWRGFYDKDGSGWMCSDVCGAIYALPRPARDIRTREARAQVMRERAAHFTDLSAIRVDEARNAG